MAKIIISSDSTCDLSAELKERYGVKILPLGVTLGTNVTVTVLILPLTIFCSL